MEFLNHVTLNTGHVRKSYPADVDKELYFILNRILKDSLRPGGAVVMEGYRLKSSQAGDITIGTIIASGGAPILTTACCAKGNPEIWRMLHETSRMPINPVKEPQSPYVADRLEIGAAVHLDAMQWTGDFSKCFGWLVLDPASIR